LSKEMRVVWDLAQSAAVYFTRLGLNTALDRLVSWTGPVLAKYAPRDVVEAKLMEDKGFKAGNI